jgi:hypothetical protein
LSRKSQVLFGFLATATLVLVLFELLPYLAVRSEEVEIIAQIHVVDPEGYVAVTRGSGSPSSYGGFQVVYSRDNLRQRGYLSTLSDTLVMSMWDISLTAGAAEIASQPTLLKVDGCYIFTASNVFDPARYVGSFWGHYIGLERIPLKNGDRWEQAIAGTTRCFGFNIAS